MRALALLACLAAFAGCAHLRASQPDVRQRAAAHVYEQPIHELWPKVPAVLEARGLRVREDPGNYSLVTDWRESFAGSRVASVWTRVIVLGDPLGPTRARLRAFREERTANDTLARPGSELIWGPRADMGLPTADALGGADPNGSGGSEGIADLQQLSEQLELPDGTLRAEAEGITSVRDLQLEWELVQKLDPEAARAMRAGKPVPPPAPEVTRLRFAGADPEPLADDPGVDCGVAIPGLSRVAAPGTVLLLGEIHGTHEVPRFVGHAACQAALSMAPVTVGLELPVSEADRVNAFLDSAGSPEDVLRLTESPFWSRPYQDGRSSEGTVELLQTLRALRARGLDVLVFLYDLPVLRGDAHEEQVAQTIARVVKNHPERFFLVVTGNVHDRLARGVPWNPSFESAGLRLSRALKRVIALDLAYDSGTAWICSLDRTVSCGERAAKGVDNGTRPFIHLFDERSDDGYDGVFYVGKVSAARPALGGAPRGETPPAPPPL